MSPKEKVLINHLSRGIFIGSMEGYAVFSKNDPLHSYVSYAFDSENEAKVFSEKYFSQELSFLEYLKVSQTIQVNPENQYVHVIDLIKSGHKENSKELFINLPCYYTETIQ